MSTPSTPVTGKFPGTLYVFLHGLIGVHRVYNPDPNRDRLDLLIPDVGTSHVYRFGEFLGEVTLPPSAAPYHITGIQKGTASFDSDVHLVTAEPLPFCAGTLLYARISLPLPYKVHSYLQVELDSVIEDPGRHLARAHNGKLYGTMIPVLEYHFDDPRDLLFGCEPLNVAPIFHKGEWYVNLHIFAEEDLDRPEDHTIGGFQNVASLFDFPCAPKLLSISNIPQVKRVGTRPPGTTEIEFSSLALRTREVGILGRLVRDQLLSHPHVPAIVRVSPVGGDPITCLPLISQ